MNRVVRFIDYCDLIWVGDLCYPISSRACGMELKGKVGTAMSASPLFLISLVYYCDWSWLGL
jgi:hypothetical protein